MSLQQIWGRVKQLARSHRIDELFRGDDIVALRHAEALILEAEERDRREELKGFLPLDRETAGSGVKIDRQRMAYEAACRVLGVSPDASFELMVGVYRAGIALHHPDRNGWRGEEGVRRATRRTQELNEAFGVVRKFRSGQT